MTQMFKQTVQHFRRDESGQVLVPFIIWIPLFLMLIISTIELGTLTVRHTVLERALDQTVREVRLSNAPINAATLKQKICARAKVLTGCSETLHLEMVALNMRNWSAPNTSADCVDTTQTVTSNRTFDHGVPHEMMMLRACYKYKPLTPAGGLGASLAKDAQGYTALVSTSAFVHEPR
ncbi:MAG: pilus assembly protein [Pelagimonas sp.]|jgi:Flp pilus assembly protein TadG|nr:pilus assembly protein [Pelagimonas sp.]